ncbi:SGNH/GDSL hydrolase family protein [Arthrobacter castelli]|uniref:SGNH/GDSL hydrolase family protein n=1 Tax=Arthrobacter castelli TaxID=271431 RepID=UPI0004086C5C|nr:SGNH/GDSL hydrolase family protein [Arthrobacter castelli]
MATDQDSTNHPSSTAEQELMFDSGTAPPQDAWSDISAEGELNESRSHPWRRYVAVGDSFTEGIGDPDEQSPGGHRGWADRIAEELSRGHQDFAYANLAIRGRVLQQIIDEQIEPALELKPDLVTISAGGNDILRPSSDPDALAEKLDGAVGRLSSEGATVVLFTGPDVGSPGVLSAVRGKTAIYNENIRTIATRHDAVIADMWALRELADPQMWAGDRLHFSPLGHHTIAIMALDSLAVVHSLHPQRPKPLPPKNWRAARAEDLVWAREFFLPWVIRRIRHQSSGDGVQPKRPQAGPIFGSGMPPGSN